MQILVKPPAAGTITVEIESCDTLDDIKRRICEKIGIPADDQRLLYGGKQLEDGLVLDQINLIQTRILDQPHDSVEDHDPASAYPTVFLLLRLRGGTNAIFHRVQFVHSSSSESESSDHDEPLLFTQSITDISIQPPRDTGGDDGEASPFSILDNKSVSIERLRRWRQSDLVLNASRRFRYTLDLEREEEKKQILRKIRSHAQVLRSAMLFKLREERANEQMKEEISA